MIPVVRQPEPPDFDREVRQKGVAWLAAHGLPAQGPLPPKIKVNPYWRHCLPELHRAYGGICAYLCMHFERILGASSVDHFVAKSQNAEQIYEWNNYRLTCRSMNSRKGTFEDVLDPFSLAADTFRLELVSGRIYPSPRLVGAEQTQAEETIMRLGLDDAECRELRTRYLDDYRQGQITLKHLRAKSPFVHGELVRQEGPSPACYPAP